MVSGSRSRRTGAQAIFTTLLALAMAISLVGLNVGGVHAATITVTTAADSGAGSLRQAIIDAVAGDTITFSALFNTPQTISFTASSEMAINKSLTITGPGSANLTIDAGNFSRIFNISGGANTVAISGMTLTKGKVIVAGGAILNSSLLTLDDVTVTANQASGLGGGIASTGGTVTLKNSTVSNNTAGLGTGGVGNIGPLTIQNSTISGNTATAGNGGGINNTGAVSITDSTISGNSANGITGNGGGINITGGLTIATSTISGNNANGTTTLNGNGGGIAHTGGALIIKRSTLSGNSASSATNATGSGGAISTVNPTNTSTVANTTLSGNSAKVGGAITLNGIPAGPGTLAVQNATIANNTVSSANSGGGIRVVGAAGTANLNIGNTILSNANGNIVKATVAGTANVTSQSGNVASDAAGLANSQNSTDPLLDTAGLQNNGGPTKTIVLQAASPALGYGIAGTCSNGNVGSVDQRGLARPQGTACDAGATESRATTIVADDVSAPAGGTMTLKATLTDTSTATPANLSGQKIIFKLNGTQICDNAGGGYPAACPTTDSSGVAQLTGVAVPSTPTGLNAGAIQALFDGATDLLPSSDSSDLTILILQYIDFTQPGTATFGDPPVTINATSKKVSDDSPTGLLVSFTSLTTSVCTVGSSSLSSNVSQASVTLVAPGTCTIQASQAGDAAYAPATDVSKSFTVLAVQYIDFTQPGAATYGDAPVAISATSKQQSDDAATNLTVAFATQTPLVCSVGASTLTGGVSQASVTILAAGTCTIQATQAGDATYAAATAVTKSFTVNKKSLTVTANNANRPFGSTTVPCTVTFDGFVNNDNQSVISGAATCTTTATSTSPSGTSYPLTPALGTLSAANYTFGPFVNGTLTIDLAPTAITKVALTGTYGSTTGTLTATLKNTIDNKPIANATITFKVNGVAVCGGAKPACPKTNAQGVATFAGQTVPLRDAGTYGDYQIEASFAGDSTYLPSTGQGKLELERLILLVKPVDQTVKLKQPNPTGCTLQLVAGSQFVNGDDWSDINLTNLRCTNSRNYPSSNASETVGKQYKISATGVSAKNYDIRYQQGTLTVVP